MSQIISVKKSTTQLGHRSLPSPHRPPCLATAIYRNKASVTDLRRSLVPAPILCHFAVQPHANREAKYFYSLNSSNSFFTAPKIQPRIHPTFKTSALSSPFNLSNPGATSLPCREPTRRRRARTGYGHLDDMQKTKVNSKGKGADNRHKRQKESWLNRHRRN